MLATNGCSFLELETETLHQASRYTPALTDAFKLLNTLYSLLGDPDGAYPKRGSHAGEDDQRATSSGVRSHFHKFRYAPIYFENWILYVARSFLGVIMRLSSLAPPPSNRLLRVSRT